MKKILLVLGFLLLTVAVSVTFPCYNQLFALSGCCLDRHSYRAQWRPNRMTFRECSNKNRREDGDNIFDRAGLVWWDVRCR